MMKKVLLVSMGESFGGIEKLELDYIKYINKGNIAKLSLLVPNRNTFSLYNTDCDDIYYLNATRKTRIGRILYDYKFYKFLKKYDFDIVHINSSAFFYSFRVALISKICRKKVVVHSHNYYSCGLLKRFFMCLLNPIYSLITDDYLSCSKYVQSSLFNNRFKRKHDIKVLNNGINTLEFKFDMEMRKKCRSELGIDKRIVIGHTGRLCEQKNQSFLIDLFYDINKINNNTVLLLVGDGMDLDKLKNKVNNLELTDSVMFLGLRNDISNLLNAMDIFVFPSLYEGLGISAIEAQCSGLVTYCSNEVVDEVNISSFYRLFHLDDNIKLLADKILNEKIKISDRIKGYKEVKKANYDISYTKKSLEDIYNNL